MKTGKPLRRRTPLKPGRPGLMRKTPMRQVNRKRRAEEWRRAYGSRGRVEWIHRQCCYACGSGSGSESSHYPSRGAGGGADDQIPMCGKCHWELHQYGAETFQELKRVGLLELARKATEEWGKYAGGFQGATCGSHVRSKRLSPSGVC